MYYKAVSPGNTTSVTSKNNRCCTIPWVIWPHTKQGSQKYNSRDDYTLDQPGALATNKQEAFKCSKFLTTILPEPMSACQFCNHILTNNKGTRLKLSFLDCYINVQVLLHVSGLGAVAILCRIKRTQQTFADHKTLTDRLLTHNYIECTCLQDMKTLPSIRQHSKNKRK